MPWKMLTAYLLSCTASAVPFQPLTADQLRRAAASDEGAHRVAELLLQRRLPADTARVALLEGFCSSLTRRARHTTSANLVSSVFLRLLSTMPLRLLVILLGRLYSRCSSQRLSPESHLFRRRANRHLASLLLLASCTPWPASPRRARLPVTPAPLMSVVFVNSISSFVRSFQTSATFIPGGRRLAAW